MKARFASLTIMLAVLAAVPAVSQYDVYDNGPTNGITDAWAINFGFMATDSFRFSSGTRVTGLQFAAWLFPGDVLQSAEVSITSAAFFGTTYFDQVVAFTQSNCVYNPYGYELCTEAASFSTVNLNAGTYWLTLKNATVNTGDPIYWDENSGPSRALACCDKNLPEGGNVWPNALGTIPSESFTVLGYHGCGDGKCQDGASSSGAPEPSSLLLLSSGGVFLFGLACRLRKLF